MGPFKDGWTKAQVESVIRDNRPDEVLYAPVVVTMDPPDLAWAESICVQLAKHDHFSVRGNEILGFGHLARIFRSASDDARRLVAAALNDSEEYVRGQAEVARDDIEHFTKKKLMAPDAVQSATAVDSKADGQVKPEPESEDPSR